MKYIDCFSINNIPTIEVTNLVSFIEEIKESNDKLYRLIKSKGKRRESTTFLHHNGIIGITLASNGFQTLEEMGEAAKLNFQSGSNYNHFLSLGLNTRNEYDQFITLKFEDMDEWSNFTKGKYSGAFDKLWNYENGNVNQEKERRKQIRSAEFQKLKAQGEQNIIQENTGFFTILPSAIIIFQKYTLENDRAIFQHSSDKGYKGFSDLMDGIELDIELGEEYYEFKKSKYKSIIDFRAGNTNGFTSASKFYQAAKLEIKNAAVFESYSTARNAAKKEGLATIEELYLQKILEDHFNEVNTKFSTEKLIIFWDKIISNDFRKRGFPDTLIFNTIDSEEVFLTVIKSNIYFQSNYFFTDEESMFLKRNYKKINKNLIIIDGSNVAFEGMSFKDGEKASYDQLYNAIYELDQEYPNLKVLTLVDASLRHKIDNPDKLAKLVKEGNCEVVPAHTEADDFILQIAKREKALVISNDTFSKDWKIRDEWLSENIDFFRIPFIITDGKITFSSKLHELLK